jgi:hypothetical protein
VALKCGGHKNVVCIFNYWNLSEVCIFFESLSVIRVGEAVNYILCIMHNQLYVGAKTDHN